MLREQEVSVVCLVVDLSVQPDTNNMSIGMIAQTVTCFIQIPPQRGRE
jgi:hypothetical protein